jgi:hypothetical protein
MPTDSPPSARPLPLGVEEACRYLDAVLAFQAAHGGPFLRSLELEFAVRRLTRAWVRACLAERALPGWLAFAAQSALGPGEAAAAVSRGLRAWAADECALVAARFPPPDTTPANAA